MKYSKNLNIKGASLDKEAFKRYIEKVAENHNVVTNTKKKTYPIPDLKDNLKFIFETYKILNEHLKLGIRIHSAGEWLLDNFYLIEETVKNIEKDLSLKKYISLYGIGDGDYKGYSRIYELASEIIGYSDSKIDLELISNAITSYQNKKLLTNEELTMLPLFLKISLIQNITECAEKIYISELQKIKVEDIIRRIIDNEEDEIFNTQRFKIKVKNKFDYSDLKNSFVEYMTYKLKQKGHKALPYLSVLENQVIYSGSSVEEIVRKEHLHIASIKATIGNSIMSIKNINRMNFKELFENLNVINTILSQDPALVFDKMDEDTKEMYLREISNLSKKYKFSEIYIAKKVVELCLQNKDSAETKKSHVGYYLISDGKYELLSTLTGKKVDKLKENNKSVIFVRSTFYIPIILSVLNVYLLKLSFFKSITIFVLSIFLFEEIYVKTVMYIASKVVKPKNIPKINLYGKVEKNISSFVVIPTIINSKEKIDDLINKIEIYYHANKSDNLYFAILGDCTTSEREYEEIDDEIISYGKYKINLLNEKYCKNDDNNIFFFLYRKRRWNSKEGKFLGWERKRGLLTQFNNYLLKKDNGDFLINTINQSNFNQDIKYVITLDSDTNLILSSAFKMIGAMEHILNVPEIRDGKVVSGYGIMQPKICTSLKDSVKSTFSKIYSSNQGMNLYSIASYDFYQDIFKEAIFTGKGIYNLKVYSEIMNGKIKENEVLSHDLLESNYLRCAFLSDVMLVDSYPYKVISYFAREHRWIRGDWQLLRWLKKTEKDINLISKYKIYDNLRRSVLLIIEFIVFFFSLIINEPRIMVLALLVIFIQVLFDILDKVIFRKSQNKTIITANKNFEFDYSGMIGNLVRTSINFSLLPYTAYMSMNAIMKTIYRLKIKKNLLEWTTSEDAEKLSIDSIENYYKVMWPNLIFGIIIFGFLNPFAEICGSVWILAPFIAWYLSIENRKHLNQINDDDAFYLIDIGYRTWKYFETYMDENVGYLPPDNFQEDRKVKIAYRTSSTNIGLGIIACISAYDLNYIGKDKVVFYIRNIISTVEKLEKWNGHLYNWYDLKTLKPLYPRYVSSVDSGNFVGYLYVVKEFLKELIDVSNDIENMIDKIDEIICNTNFSYFYNEGNKLFSIGYDVENMKLTDSYYDFLASEARQASFIAIAKKDIDEKHWQSLSRTLSTLNGYKGLISWSGTAFEYLMPTINMNSYLGSLLDESARFMIMAQKKYSKKLNIPWGISESAYSIKDLNGNYQYKAFGIPILGLKRGLEDEIVVSPYSTFLALKFEKENAIQNMKLLEKCNMLGKYGFYESIDYTKTRLKKKEEYKVVKTYMAHHQGLILAAINNYMNGDILNERFSKNPEVESSDILLQEKMPNSILISKNRNDFMKKTKYYNEYYDKNIILSKIEDLKFNRVNIISNDKYQIISDMYGNVKSTYKNIQINRYYENGINYSINDFWIKDLNSGDIYSKEYFKDSMNTEICFSSFANEYKVEKDDLSIEYKITSLSSGKGEIRRLIIENLSNEDKNIEVTFAIEPMISSLNQDISHLAFNNMFLNFEHIESEDLFVITRRDRNIENDKYKCKIKMYTNGDDIAFSKSRYETDKELFCGRKNIDIPRLVLNSSKYENRIKDTINPILAINKEMKISPGENGRIIVDFIIDVEDIEEKESAFEKYNNLENRNMEFMLSKAKTEEEIKYLKLNGDKIEIYNKILGHLIKNDIPKEESVIEKFFKDMSETRVNDLWKYGISGDKKILCIRIKSIDDLGVISEMLKCFEFLLIRNFNIDLCILNGEQNSYDMYLRENIINEVRNIQLEYLLNRSIFIIDESKVNIRDLRLLYLKSDLYIDIKYGSLKLNIDDIENKVRLNSVKNGTRKKDAKIHIEESKHYSDMVNDKLQFFNGIGGFSHDGKEYIFKSSKENEVPMPWSNVLSNKNFGTIITDNMGGFTWDKNSRLNRISTWNNEQILDIPSEVMYLKDIDKNCYFSICSRVANDMNYIVKHGIGYSEFVEVCDDLLQKTLVFVDKDNEKKNIILNIKNLSNSKRRLNLYYYIDLLLGEDKLKTAGNIICKKENNKIYIKNIFASQFKNDVIIETNINFSKIIYGKSNFFGKNTDIRAPKYIVTDEELKVDNNYTYSKIDGLAIELNIDLESFENKEVQISVVAQEEAETKEKYVQRLDDVKKYWNDLLGRLHIKTPNEKLNIFINSWCMYQILSSRIYARSGYYQSGGAIGARDQIQDALAIKYVDSNILKEYILNLASHQFEEGDVLHWWHEANGLGVRTRFSDDLLWLVYATCEYIEFTGDINILDEEIEYLKSDPLKDIENERCMEYSQKGIKENLFNHCVRAIEKGINLGKDDIPLIGSGDWNDGFSNIGSKGYGQSIWLGFFLCNILDRFESVLKMKGEEKLIEKYTKIKETISKALNNIGWDGKWFLRAISDSNDLIGSNKNRECMIDSISQAWSVISNVGEKDKQVIAMENVKKYLVDEENKIIKLLYPSFSEKEFKPGYISRYKDGIRENGGQYTHGVIWSIKAFILLGEIENAYKLIEMINPITHGENIEIIKKYKAEPYVIAGDVYTNKDMCARGGWSWYTGAAAWLYKITIEDILGINIKGDMLEINPNIPEEWNECSINYFYKDSEYKIFIKRNKELNNIKPLIKLNGVVQEDKGIKMDGSGGDFTIDIEM